MLCELAGADIPFSTETKKDGFPTIINSSINVTGVDINLRVLLSKTSLLKTKSATKIDLNHETIVRELTKSNQQNLIIVTPEFTYNCDNETNLSTYISDLMNNSLHTDAALFTSTYTQNTNEACALVLQNGKILQKRRKLSINNPLSIFGLTIGMQLCIENSMREYGGFKNEELDLLVVSACGLTSPTFPNRILTAENYWCKKDGYSVLVDGTTLLENNDAYYSLTQKGRGNGIIGSNIHDFIDM